jgi:hypothetical protein
MWFRSNLALTPGPIQRIGAGDVPTTGDEGRVGTRESVFTLTVQVEKGVSRMWGNGDVGDMTGRSFAGWGIVDGVGLALG